MNLLTPLRVSDQAREERLAAQAEAKIRDTRTAMEALNKRRSEASEERKALARQKIEQLKQRLQMVQSMASADPKGTARLAAQLARELGAAVKEYAAAGGTGAAGNGSVARTSAAAEASVDGEATAAAASAEPGSGAAASAAGTPETQKDGENGEDGGKPANPYQQAIDQQQARAAEFSRRTEQARADQEFLGEARKLAARIRAMVRNAADRSPGEEGSVGPEEARELKATVAELDRKIETAQGDLGGSISILV